MGSGVVRSVPPAFSGFRLVEASGAVVDATCSPCFCWRRWGFLFNVNSKTGALFTQSWLSCVDIFGDPLHLLWELAACCLHMHSRKNAASSMFVSTRNHPHKKLCSPYPLCNHGSGQGFPKRNVVFQILPISFHNWLGGGQRIQFADRLQYLNYSPANREKLLRNTYLLTFPILALSFAMRGARPFSWPRKFINLEPDSDLLLRFKSASKLRFSQRLWTSLGLFGLLWCWLPLKQVCFYGSRMGSHLPPFKGCNFMFAESGPPVPARSGWIVNHRRT